MLIDTAGAWQGDDWGRRAVIPALRALGVSRLDLLIVSHADLDHRGGAESVLAGVEVDELWLPLGSRGDPGFSALAQRACVDA